MKNLRKYFSKLFFINLAASIMLLILFNQLSYAADVLLIQSANPWNSTANTRVLNNLGYSFDQVNMSQIGNTDLDSYQVILVVNDQNQQFYNYYAQMYDYFESYVESGGTLVFFACDHGWAGGNNYTDLPGHVHVGDRYNSYNLVADNSHPVVTQELITEYADPAIQDADLDGNYCSHNYFTNLPADTDIIFTTNDSDRYPTLAVYRLGTGTVIASGLTWEFTYDRYNGANHRYGFGRALPDVFKYAFSVAGGHKISGVNVDIYPEDNWAPKRPELLKGKGDLIDIVAVITNDTGATQDNITLTVEIDDNLVDSGFLYVYKRASAEEEAISDSSPVELVEGTDYEDTVTNGMRRIIVQNIAVPTKSNQLWNDFVFRFQLESNLNAGTKIDSKATITANQLETRSESLSDGGEVTIVDNAAIIITNRELMYKYYARKRDANNNWIVDVNGTKDLHSLWASVYQIASEKNAVIYFVDKYDKDGDGNHSNRTLTTEWLDRSSLLPYDPDRTTNNEEGQVNQVVNLIDAMLDGRGSFENKGFIEKLGGEPRQLLILGGDRIIPFYRVFDSGQTVYDNRTDHDASSITRTDADNNYTFSDVIFRDLDGKGWGKADVENIYVGRVSGTKPKDMEKFLVSSSTIGSIEDSNNVVKVENNQRNCELNNFVSQSNKADYTIISDIQWDDNGTPVNVTLDQDNPGGCILGLADDSISDPARWKDFRALFTGNASNAQDFDVMRFMCHGSTSGLYGSSGFSDPYMNGGNIKTSRTIISTSFDNYNPLFVFDACLVGIVDDEPINQSNNYHFLNHLMPTGIRGAYAASGVTYTPNISDYNDSFTKYAFADGYILGKAATMANKKGHGFWNSKIDKYHSFIMNYFGAPWGSLMPPVFRPVEEGENPLTGAGSLAANQVHMILPNGTGETHSIQIEPTNYTLSQHNNFDLVRVEGFELSYRENEPVLPVGSFEVKIPLNATVDTVTVDFKNNRSLGTLNIPASSYRAVNAIGLQRVAQFVDCPTELGVYPTEQYAYNIVKYEEFQEVVVTVFPVSFDTSNREAILSEQININVNYSSPSSGILKAFALDNDTYGSHQTISAYVTLENTSSTEDDFSVSLKIENEDGNIVNNTSSNATIPSGEERIIELALAAPTEQGRYTVYASLVGDEKDSYKYINVVSGKIDDFVAPTEILVDNYGTFTTRFTNSTNSQITALETIYLFDIKGAEVAKLPQKVETIAGNGVAVTETQWFPPASLEPGAYRAQLVVEVNGAVFIKYADFELKGAEIPGDLNGDSIVDRSDIAIIQSYLNQPASSYPDCDIDGDGTITVLDARKLMQMCTYPRCASGI